MNSSESETDSAKSKFSEYFLQKAIILFENFFLSELQTKGNYYITVKSESIYSLFFEYPCRIQAFKGVRENRPLSECWSFTRTASNAVFFPKVTPDVRLC